MTEDERQAKLASLACCKKFGEKAYDEMYEAHSSGGSSGRYSDAKEAFYDAIRFAEELGMPEEAEALRKRLEHIKAVFRSQFAY